jgi:hypothetical protein
MVHIVGLLPWWCFDAVWKLRKELKLKKWHHYRIINHYMELTWSRPLHSSAAIIKRIVVKMVDGLSNILLLGWLTPVGHRTQDTGHRTQHMIKTSCVETNLEIEQGLQVSKTVSWSHYKPRNGTYPRAAQFTTVLWSSRRQLWRWLMAWAASGSDVYVCKWQCCSAINLTSKLITLPWWS